MDAEARTTTMSIGWVNITSFLAAMIFACGSMSIIPPSVVNVHEKFLSSISTAMNCNLPDRMHHHWLRSDASIWWYDNSSVLVDVPFPYVDERPRFLAGKFASSFLFFVWYRVTSLLIHLCVGLPTTYCLLPTVSSAWWYVVILGDNVNSKKERRDAKLRAGFFLFLRLLLETKNRRAPRPCSSFI